MHIRQQTRVELDDLNIHFMTAFMETWGTQGILAARCFGLGC